MKKAIQRKCQWLVYFYEWGDNIIQKKIDANYCTVSDGSSTFSAVICDQYMLLVMGILNIMGLKEKLPTKLETDNKV